MRLKIIVSLTLALFLSLPAVAQNDRDSTEAIVNAKTLRVDYGRPGLYGRDVLSMASVGTVWRVGADQATEIESSGELLVGGTQLKAGRYSLWARKTGAQDWILAFHPTTGVWGDPPLRDGYVAELPLSLGEAAESAELLTIQLSEKAGLAEINIQWGSSTLTGSFGVQ